jgi:hypothetical protein
MTFFAIGSKCTYAVDYLRDGGFSPSALPAIGSKCTYAVDYLPDACFGCPEGVIR